MCENSCVEIQRNLSSNPITDIGEVEMVTTKNMFELQWFTSVLGTKAPAIERKRDKKTNCPKRDEWRQSPLLSKGMYLVGEGVNPNRHQNHLGNQK